MTTRPSRVAVVTPTYNERMNIQELHRRLRAAVPEARLYVVDDASPDGTGAVVEGLGDPLVTLLPRTGKLGIGSAYVLGFERALADGCDRVVQMDADLSHDPADVPRLLAEDADLVLGSRYVPGGGTVNWPLYRQILSRGGSVYARLWLGLPFRDVTGGFKAWRAPTLAAALAAPVRSEGYVFQVEMTLRASRAGARIREVPILFTERVGGVSKLSRAIAVEAATSIPALRFR